MVEVDRRARGLARQHRRQLVRNRDVPGLPRTEEGGAARHDAAGSGARDLGAEGVFQIAASHRFVGALAVLAMASSTGSKPLMLAPDRAAWAQAPWRA